MGLNVIMMGPPGPGRARRRGGSRASAGCRRSRPATSCARRSRSRTRSRSRRKTRMDRGELVDDATMIAIVRDRLARPDAQRRVRARRVSADGGAGARRSTRIMAERGQRAARRGRRRGAREELVRRLAARRICSKCGTNADPPATGAACAKCGGELVQRADDNRTVVLRAAEGVPAGDAAGARLLPRAADVPRGQRRAGAGAGGRSELDRGRSSDARGAASADERGGGVGRGR